MAGRIFAQRCGNIGAAARVNVSHAALTAARTAPVGTARKRRGLAEAVNGFAAASRIATLGVRLAKIWPFCLPRPMPLFAAEARTKTF